MSRTFPRGPSRTGISRILSCAAAIILPMVETSDRPDGAVHITVFGNPRHNRAFHHIDGCTVIPKIPDADMLHLTYPEAITTFL